MTTSDLLHLVLRMVCHLVCSVRTASPPSSWCLYVEAGPK
ncbi:hypothetical protein FQN60_016049, partial [Etheostoma spectabile]